MENVIEKLNEIFTLNSKWYINSRESSVLEFKESFNWSNRDTYLKIISSFANNRGWFIIFWIKNSPKVPIWLLNNKFEETEPENISEYIKATFSSSIEFESNIYEFLWKKFAYIYVYESKNKPILCVANRWDKLFDGDIIFRNWARSEKIDSNNLIRLISEKVEKEKKEWQNILSKITKIWASNVSLLNLNNWEISENWGKIIIDDNILNKITFIKEGNFSEVQWAPTLRLIWEIKESWEILEIEIDPNEKYLYSTKDLWIHLGFWEKNAVSNIVALIKFYELKKDNFSYTFNISPTNKPTKYSKECLDFLQDKKENWDFSNDVNSEKMKEIRKIARNM